MNAIQTYLENINKRYQTGIAREHAYRGDLQNLLEQLLPDVLVTNEPARVDCGAPDYILTRKDIPMGYIEAKDIGKPLASKEYKEQFDRYRNALSNLIITDYLQFEFYREGKKTTSIVLATLEEGHIKVIEKNVAQFINLMADFVAYQGQTLTNADALAKMMAGKARLMANVIERVLVSDAKDEADSSLQGQMAAFKSILMHEIEPKEFADIYSQTITYGMFAARLHDTALHTFSRQEAAEKIPHSNPFLRKLFQYIAGYDLDSRLVWMVDALADIFRAADVAQILKNFGRSTAQRDPMIHFYETFLAEYDPKLRKSRGVWYTPEPVVDFIVRAVDEILKSDFALEEGLADTSKTSIKVEMPVLKGRGKNRATRIEKVSKEIHKVQVLDPATGTGTFLAAVVKHIYQQGFEGMQGVWSAYVENDLIPRLNGFEILMASYAMAHLKLDLLLTETGFKSDSQQRFNIYLTNSLEEQHPDSQSLFATWLSQEANEANRIKRDAPVMVVMGNPPYAVSSSNKGAWIADLLKDYKKDLNERNIQPLSDDYIKFIRYGQHYIEKNGEGILAYISNNSFIDGVIHRQMRQSLLECFDSIYILDLHGNSKKKETAPDGGKDENVFDIMQGVSINIFVKRGGKTKNLPVLKGLAGLAQVFHLDLYGKRKEKYKVLQDNSLASLDWNKLEYRAPEYFFVPKDFGVQKKYEKGFSVNELFPISSSGIQTKRDKLFIDINKENLEQRIKLLLSEEFDKKFITNFNIKDSSSYFLMRKIGKCDFLKENIHSVFYRPFDEQFIYYDKELLGRPFYNVMQHLLKEDSLAILFPRQAITEKFGFFVSNKICDINFTGVAGQYGAGLVFPLYLYPESTTQQSLDENTDRKPNLNSDIVKQIATKLDLNFVAEKNLRGLEDLGGLTPENFAPIDLLDYIYAVLHSPSYLETYKEFLKIDFPRIPYPNKKTFWQLVQLGGELRQLHLLESPLLEAKHLQTTYPENGDNHITRKINKNDYQITDTTNNRGQVWINDQQYFDNVPKTVWDFYIGGYQPAQKWLKDRKKRTLNRQDIQHYRKIIQTLIETDKLMQKIDKLKVLY